VIEMSASWSDWALGHKLNRLRKADGRTLREAAEAIGVTPQFISAVEKGRSSISLSKLKSLLNFYHSSFAESFPEKPAQGPVIRLEDAVPLNSENPAVYTAFLHHFSNTPQIELVYQRLDTGFRATMKQHESAEVYFVLSGSVDCILESPVTKKQTSYNLSQYDTLRVGDMILHCLVCQEQGAEILAISYSNGESKHDDDESDASIGPKQNA